MIRTFVNVDRTDAEVIRRAVEWKKGDNPDYRFGEDDTLVYGADFGNGIEMDIKCCGVQYEENGINNAWCEAVLFDNGTEVAVSDVEDDFFGEWELPYNNVTYVAEVVCV